MKHITIVVAVGAFCAVAAAQTTQPVPLGTFANTGTTWATRGGAATPNTNPSVLFVRHDLEHYAGWTTGATIGTRDIRGLNFVVQDQNLATQDTFALVVYQDDPLLPNFPDVVNNVVTSGNFVLPAGTGGGAYNASGNFATPLSLPATVDIYVGLQLNAGWTISGGQITDGLSVWEIRAAAPTSPQPGQAWDEPGASISQASPDNTYGGYYCANPAAGPAYPVQTQYKITPTMDSSGGVGFAQTSQTNHVESTATSATGFTVQYPTAGTACMFSALYPDAASPPVGAGRADEIGQMYHNPRLPAGSLVFYLIDIGTFANPEIPASTFVPGSTGVNCLNLGTMQVLGFQIIGANGRSWNRATFPAAARQFLQGIDWLQQAVGLDPVTNTIHGSACTRQKT